MKEFPKSKHVALGTNVREAHKLPIELYLGDEKYTRSGNLITRIKICSLIETGPVQFKSTGLPD